MEFDQPKKYIYTFFLEKIHWNERTNTSKFGTKLSQQKHGLYSLNTVDLLNIILETLPLVLPLRLKQCMKVTAKQVAT